MISRLLALFLSVYIPVYIDPPYAIDCGNNSASFNSDKAFDGDIDASGSSYFESSQSGAAVANTACVGWSWAGDGGFYASQPVILSWLQSNTTTHNAGGVNVEAWNGSSWQYIDSYSTGTAAGWQNLSVIGVMDSYAGLRIIPTTFAGAGRWRIYEMRVLMAQPDPAAQADTPTPTITPTPSVTPTPSSTPTATPNYYAEITSTTGAPMRFERGADAGDLLTFTGLMVIAFILIVGFAVSFWQRRNVS